jgi:predicted  nucleic acid-binding Zn-ribbon protein
MLDAESECRKCGKMVSYEQYKLDKFCPDCGTFLHRPRQPKRWIFQFNPAIYRWFDWIKANRETEQWLTSQHARDIHKRDKVAIWASGDKAGIYAIGEIEANPSKRPLNLGQEKYWTGKADVYKFREKNSVTIKYMKVIIDRPLLEDKCSKDPILSAMEILKQPQGTNFQLTREQWNRILELMNEKHQINE